MRWVIFIILFILVDIYAFQAVRTATKIHWIYYVYFGISALVLANFLYQIAKSADRATLTGSKAYAFGFLLSLMVGQIILIIVMFSEDIVRFLISLFTNKNYSLGDFHMPSRRSFLSRIALGLAAIPFASLLYGMYKGKYNFKVLKYELEFDDLPDAFDGYQITQISDIHCGSFDNKKKIQYGVDLIKEQDSDVIFFTGDMVNNRVVETDDWKEMFGSISAPDGVFSVLGNHDYGDYYPWNSEEEKKQNLQDLIQVERDMGWDILLNERREIKRDGQNLHIVGVQNWGRGHFSKHGDLDKAGEGLQKDDFKILLSHDPSYWQEKIKSDRTNYQLTLSGHTHGMQFGIEIPGVVKWSPIQYKYENWAGIYREFGRYINVNRGFGYLAYPGRVGIWPEITVIKLKKAKT